LKLTIFTPTYNRANLLERVFQSLIKQSACDFEWLIIDDGSSDNTEDVVERYLANTSFSVRYFRKENGGKHSAHNFAINVAKGDYFMCLDSDDQLSDDAIESLFPCLNNCDINSGIIAYKADKQGNLLSNTFPNGIVITNTVDLTIKYCCDGEFTLIYPTQLLRKNPFPIFENERFITECVLYDRLSDFCDMRLLPKVMCICEYQEEGYSNNINTIMKNNPAGFCLYYMQRIDLEINQFRRMIASGKYQCFRIFAKDNKSNYNGKHRILVLFSRPLGIAFAVYYKLFRSF